MIQDPLSFFQRSEKSKTALVWAQSQKTGSETTPKRR
jgi:hypothetical protein